MLDIACFKEKFTPLYGFRLVSATDSQMILNWRNSEHVKKYMHNQDVISLENHKKWLSNTLQSAQDLYFIYNFNQRPVGLLCFNKIHDFSSEWGFYLGETDLPQGTGTDMLQKGMQLAFETIGLHHITATVTPQNKRSDYIHKKLGFQKEVILQDHCGTDDQCSNEIRFRLSKKNYL